MSLSLLFILLIAASLAGAENFSTPMFTTRVPVALVSSRSQLVSLIVSAPGRVRVTGESRVPNGVVIQKLGEDNVTIARLSFGNATSRLTGTRDTLAAAVMNPSVHVRGRRVIDYVTGIRVTLWNGTDVNVTAERELYLWRGSFGLMGVVTDVWLNLSLAQPQTRGYSEFVLTGPTPDIFFINTPTYDYAEWVYVSATRTVQVFSSKGDVNVPVSDALPPGFDSRYDLKDLWLVQRVTTLDTVFDGDYCVSSFIPVYANGVYAADVIRSTVASIPRAAGDFRLAWRIVNAKNRTSIWDDLSPPGGGVFVSMRFCVDSREFDLGSVERTWNGTVDHSAYWGRTTVSFIPTQIPFRTIRTPRTPTSQEIDALARYDPNGKFLAGDFLRVRGFRTNPNFEFRSDLGETCSSFGNAWCLTACCCENSLTCGASLGKCVPLNAKPFKATCRASCECASGRCALGLCV